MSNGDRLIEDVYIGTLYEVSSSSKNESNEVNTSARACVDVSSGSCGSSSSLDTNISADFLGQNLLLQSVPSITKFR
jgi:hypothetical protein